MPVIDRFVTLKITNQGKYYEALGYGHMKQGTLVSVSIQDLPKNSNKIVRCSCDDCSVAFDRKYQAAVHERCNGKVLCFSCARLHAGKTNHLAQKGKPREFQRGENHPRWRSNKTEFAAYCREVTRHTNACKHIWSRWEHFDKIGRCGVDGAYQLDHKMPKRYGFENSIPPEMIGNIQNLQIIPWKTNRSKGYKYTEEMIQWL